jgi:ech hydrogenase subunit F
MTSTVLRNLVQKSSTRLYPIEVRAPFDEYRGELYNEIEKCIFCSSCSRVCPSQCLTVDKKEGTWHCDAMACVYCGLCVEACPVDCLHQKNTYRAVSQERIEMMMKGTPPKKKSAKKKEE